MSSVFFYEKVPVIVFFFLSILRRSHCCAFPHRYQLLWLQEKKTGVFFFEIKSPSSLLKKKKDTYIVLWRNCKKQYSILMKNIAKNKREKK